jgi:beta-glucosidase
MMTDYLDELISSLTLQEKAALCTGAGPWTTTPIDRLGVPPLMVADGPHGIRRVADLGSMTQVSMPATCFPTASCSASTWNTDLIRAMGEAIAEEAIALGVDVVLGPGVNIKRSPLGGRNFEYFSEDPYLAGAMATNFIRGVQSKGVGTSLKHYAANNQEFQRFSISAEIDERTLREIYLAAFEMAVREARPWTVMCSYNKVNGVFAAEHHDLLTRILRGEWGFEGFVVSDWGAVRDRVASLRAGLDLEMPGPQPRHVQSVVDAVNDGRLPESLLVEAVRRILRIVNAAQQTPKGGAFDADAHHALARKIAAEGMVLLKNDGLLPLRNGQRIAVIGRSAQMAYYQGGGSSHINPPRVDVPFVELGLRAPQSKLGYAEGYPGDDVFRQDMIDEAVALAREADVAVLLLALPAYKESEGYDRQDLDLTAQQVALVRAVAVAQPRAVVVLNNGAPVSMSEWIAHVPAVLEGWMMGQAGGGAIADILFGLTNPSGKLTETFPLRLIDTPAHLNWPGGAGKVNYGEGLYLGYRYYDARDMPVQFPFGHGLSYTTFAYSNPQVSAVSFRDVDGVTVTVDVTNTGPVAGKEIVQFYVHDVASGLVRPEKELKGFAKVALAPGATETVGVELDFRSFAYFHPEYGQWIAEEGDFDILIGSSAARIHHTLRVTLQATRELPCVLDDESTIREWIADPRGQAVLGPMFARMEENSRRMFEGNEGGPGLGMSFMEMLGDMPLVSVLMWQQDMLPLHPEEVVAGLLAQVHDRK